MAINGYYRDQHGIIERKTIPAVDGHPLSPFAGQGELHPTGEIVWLYGWEHHTAEVYRIGGARRSDGEFLIPKKEEK